MSDFNYPNGIAWKNDESQRVGPFALHGKVEIDRQIGWITGFSAETAYVQNSKSQYVHPGTPYKQVSLSKLKLCSHNNNWKVKLSYD